MKISMAHPASEVPLIGSPLKLSDTPVRFRRLPPTLGQPTDEVLEGLLKLTAVERAALREGGII